LSQLTYLGDVIKEAMRLWPVTAVGPHRELAADIVVSDTVTLPKGSFIGVGIFAMFRSVELREPDLFLPERWAEGDPDAAKLKELFIPFSTGRRNCIGQPLASLELKMALATIFKKFDFQLVSEVQDFFFLTLKPKVRLCVRVALVWRRPMCHSRPFPTSPPPPVLNEPPERPHEGDLLRVRGKTSQF